VLIERKVFQMKHPIKLNIITKKDLAFQPIIRHSSFSLILGGMMWSLWNSKSNSRAISSIAGRKSKSVQLNVDQIKKIGIKYNIHSNLH